MDCCHEEFEEVASHNSNGLPVRLCLKCDNYFTDDDLTYDACRYAAKCAGAKDRGWARRYVDNLGSQGFAVIPWPAHMVMPHGGVAAHDEIKRPSEDVDVIVIDGEVFRAMARALEGAI